MVLVLRKFIRSFLISELESYIFLEYKKFSRGRFFFELGLKSSISQNIRSFLGFPFPKIWGIFWGWIFFIFSGLGWKVQQVAIFFFFFFQNVPSQMFGSALNMRWVLNMPGFWIYLSRNIRKFRFLKIRKTFLRRYKKFFQVKLVVVQNITWWSWLPF